MIAAISSVLPAASATRTPSRLPASTASRTGWAFQPMPNLRREVRQAIGKAKAGWTFTTICTELGYACHKGKATWDQQRLGIGLRALARESGQDVRKVRRDCAALAELGLVVVTRPNVLHVADPATGRIVSKAKGRCDATLIYLTITEAALRPRKGHHGTEGGSMVVPPAEACKGHHGTTVREETIQRTPAGDAAVSGSPPAVAGGRLPAAEAPTATSILPVDAGRDEPPLPAGRILPDRTPARPRRQSEAEAARRNLDAPIPWDQASLAALARTKARLAAAEEERRRHDTEAEEGRRKAEAPPPPDRPAQAATEASVIERNRDAWQAALRRIAG